MNQLNEELNQWIKDSGCLVHPSIEIPAYFQGIQGIGAKENIPHKTVILAIPSKLVITVPRCYNDPELKSLFKSSDELFDYEVDEDAEFNILCVFLMYHKINMETSPWKVYLKTIAEPETAVSWPDKDLVGLNKSVIEEILHVRKECKKVEENLCNFLTKTKQFEHLTFTEIVSLFRICYPTVLTRCFGYYFSTACMIPIADLMNHGCETIDHQLIHLEFEKENPIDEEYNPKSQKINCELMGLPKSTKQTMPFRLDFLVRNELAEYDLNTLGKLRRHEIDEKIYKLLGERILKEKECQIEKIDFCEEEDEEDNDTDEDEGYGQAKSIEHIKSTEKEQMAEFHKYYWKIKKLAEVEKEVQDKEEREKQEKQKEKESNMSKEEKMTSLIDEDKLEGKQEEQTQQKYTSQQEKILNKMSESLEKQISNHNSTSEAFLPSNINPIQYIESSSDDSSASEEEDWCLDESCYFTMSTHSPVSSGSQLFNSYGSRTNKFLLVWYGFAYRNNLFDSVSLRIQAKFPEIRPKPENVVLDTYIGGQGLCFKKNEEEEVRPEEVSREFRLKRSRLPMELMIFMRLFLTNYYEGKDNYKILCTVPSSLEFEGELLEYLKKIVETLYERYPLEILNALKEMKEVEQDQSRKTRIEFKIIYLEEQRKILDENMEAFGAAAKVIDNLKKTKAFTKEVYSGLKIETIRKVREYLVELKTNFDYILYEQKNIEEFEDDTKTSVSEEKS